MIKVGILGNGYMGEIRRKCLEQNSSYDLTSMFHTEEVVGDFKYFDNWQDLIKDDSIEAVFVCLPNYLIKDAVVQSLKSGKHVFAEKPPGVSVSEVNEMIKAEKESSKVLKFGFNHRYHPAIIKAKEIVESKDLGDILWMRGRYGKSVESDFSSSWRSKKKYSGGGILMDQGIHMLDLMLHFCGNFEEAKAYASNLYWKGEIEDNVFAILRNNKGQVASLHSTMTQWRYLFSLEIFLSGGSVIVNGLLSKSGRYGQEKLAYSVNQTSSPMSTNYPDTHISKFNIDKSWDLEIDEFTNAIENNDSISIGNSQDALKLMTLIEKIYEDSSK